MNLLSPLLSLFFLPPTTVTAAVVVFLFVCFSNCSSDSGPAHLTGALSSCKHNGTYNATAMSFLKTVRAERHEVTGLVFVNTLKIFSV